MPQKIARSSCLRRAHCPPLLKTFPAEYRAALRRPERHGGLFPALRTTGLGFRAHRAAIASRVFRALGFASLAPLGLILEALVGEEHLFATGKNKLGATLRALQNLVMEFHGSVPPWDPNRKGNAQIAARKVGLRHKTRNPGNRLGSWGLRAHLC